MIEEKKKMMHLKNLKVTVAVRSPRPQRKSLPVQEKPGGDRSQTVTGDGVKKRRRRKKKDQPTIGSESRHSVKDGQAEAKNYKSCSDLRPRCVSSPSSGTPPMLVRVTPGDLAHIPHKRVLARSKSLERGFKSRDSTHAADHVKCDTRYSGAEEDLLQLDKVTKMTPNQPDLSFSPVYKKPPRFSIDKYCMKKLTLYRLSRLLVSHYGPPLSNVV